MNGGVTVKKKYIILALSIFVLGVASIGVGAAMVIHDKDVPNNEVEMEISEKNLIVSAQKSGMIDESVEVVPGKTIELNYKVTNDCKNGYDIYAKADIFFKFEKHINVDIDEEIEVLNWNDDYQDYVIFNENKENSLKKIESVEDAYMYGDWIVTYYDDEQLTMYYTKPIAYNESTDEFLSTLSFAKEMDNEFAGVEFNIEAEVTAVQANSGAEAMAAEWGMFPTIDENGVITGISETR